MTVGTYALYFQITKPISLKIGTLGRIDFSSGNYIYVGSALGPSSQALEFRVKRHFKREKPIQWHIDYLSTHKMYKHIGAVLIAHPEKMECNLVNYLAADKHIQFSAPGFGASDCVHSCWTHLLLTDLSMDEISNLIDLANNFRGRTSKLIP